MNVTPNEAADNPGAVPSARRPAGVVALVAVLALEFVALIGATVFLIMEVLVASPESYASAIALTVVVALAAVWVGAIVFGAWRGASWTRGASIVVQVLLASVALGSFQGALPRLDIGWLLLLPAIAVVVLLFTAPVRAYLRPRSGADEA